MRRKATLEVEYEVEHRPMTAERWEDIIAERMDYNGLRRVRVTIIDDETQP